MNASSKDAGNPRDPDPLTLVLERVANGEVAAADELLELVYEELRFMARGKMAALKPGQTLQATALVHEVWMKLQGAGSSRWENRAHFFGAAARSMRNILVDQLRRPHKRQVREGLSSSTEFTYVKQSPDADLIALDAALTKLEKQFERPARVVMLRHFTGLELGQIAEMLGLSRRTIDREWLFARTWLQKEMQAEREE